MSVSMDAPSGHDGVPDEDVHRQQPPDEAAATTALSPVWTKLPSEIIGMIFTEYLSVPMVHFAEVRSHQHPRGDLNAGAVTIHQWSDGEMRSGYLAANVLNATSHPARDVVRRAIEEETIIDYEDWSAMGHVTVDASTDLACLVLDRWPFMFFDPEDQINFKATLLATRIGTIHRTGVLVTKEMWKAVLARWFDPYLEDQPFCASYSMNDGRLDFRTLSWILKNFKSLEAFYMILTDITVEDWKEYYSQFPVTFHDAGGSYVEVQEESIHPWVMFRMWNLHGDLDFFNYPYRYDSKPNVNVDTTFPDRVDSKMDAKLRVRLLLGILDGARYKANGRVSKRELPKQEPRIGVLVRRPSWVVDDSVLKAHRPLQPIDDDFSTEKQDIGPDDDEGVNTENEEDVEPDDEEETDTDDEEDVDLDDEDLNSEDPEEYWVREAMNTIVRDSEQAHHDDLTDGISNPHGLVHL